MSSTGTGIFADFDGMSADWSISAFKTSDTMDMVMIVKFATQEDVSKYKAAIVKMYNSMAGAGGVTFDTYEELEAYCKENGASPRIRVQRHDAGVCLRFGGCRCIRRIKRPDACISSVNAVDVRKTDDEHSIATLRGGASVRRADRSVPRAFTAGKRC